MRKLPNRDGFLVTEILHFGPLSARIFVKGTQTSVQMPLHWDMATHRLHFPNPPMLSPYVHLPRKPRIPYHPCVVCRKADSCYSPHVNVVANELISESNMGTHILLYTWGVKQVTARGWKLEERQRWPLMEYMSTPTEFFQEHHCNLDWWSEDRAIMFGKNLDCCTGWDISCRISTSNIGAGDLIESERGRRGERERSRIFWFRELSMASSWCCDVSVVQVDIQLQGNKSTIVTDF